MSEQENCLKSLWKLSQEVNSSLLYPLFHRCNKEMFQGHRVYRHLPQILTLLEKWWMMWSQCEGLLMGDSWAPTSCREEGCSSSNGPKWQSSCSSEQHAGSPSLWGEMKTKTNPVWRIYWLSIQFNMPVVRKDKIHKNNQSLFTYVLITISGLMKCKCIQVSFGYKK